MNRIRRSLSQGSATVLALMLLGACTDASTAPASGTESDLQLPSGASPRPALPVVRKDGAKRLFRSAGGTTITFDTESRRLSDDRGNSLPVDERVAAKLKKSFDEIIAIDEFVARID